VLTSRADTGREESGDSRVRPPCAGMTRIRFDGRGLGTFLSARPLPDSRGAHHGTGDGHRVQQVSGVRAAVTSAPGRAVRSGPARPVSTPTTVISRRTARLRRDVAGA